MNTEKLKLIEDSLAQIGVHLPLSSENNDSSSLKEAYSYLLMITESNPDFAEDVLFVLTSGFLSDKNDVTSLMGFYNTLETIVSAHPVLAEQVLTGVNSALQSDKNDENSLKNAYWVLQDIVRYQPALAKQVFDTYKTVVQSDKNDVNSLIVAYDTLRSFARNPELAEQVFDVIKIGLQSDKNDVDAVNSAYAVLVKAVRMRSVLAKRFLDIVKKDLQSDKNDLKFAYDALQEIVKAQPELAEQAFEAIKIGLQSDKNSGRDLRNAYEILQLIVTEHPETAEQVLNCLKVGLKSYENDDGSLGRAYKTSMEIIKAQPELAEQVFDVHKTCLKSDKNDWDSLQCNYSALRDIVEVHPDLKKQVFDIFKTGLQSDKNNEYSLKHAYSVLREIVKVQSELAEQVLTCINVGLCSSQNNSDSLDEAYSVFDDVMNYRPELAEQVLTGVNAALQSDKNHSTSLKTAYEILSNIIVKNPALTEPAFETFGLALQSENNTTFSLSCATIYLDEIAKARPDLADKVIDTVSAYITNVFDQISIYKTCMKHLPLEEAIAKHPAIERDLRIVHKARFADDREFGYALNNLSLKQLAESNIFSAQQRVMNILVSASAQENGIEKGEAESFRRPNASKEIKDYLANNKDWLVPASFKGAAIFKEYFPAYIKQIQNHNRKNPNDALLIHDAVYWLPELNMSQEENASFAEFIRNNIIYQNAEHKMVHRPLSELKIIAQNWKALENKLQEQGYDGEISKLKYNDVLSICMSVKYADQRNDRFAVEAAKHSVPENKYHNVEDIYLAGLKVPEPFDSKKEFTEGKYTGRFLPRDDVRTGFFGDYTDCCQHFGGVGDACAVSTVKHPFSQLFVIEDEKGKIIAGSWTWENTEGEYREVCFDNIESLGELKQHPEINRIYEQVGKYLTEEQNCRRVTIGFGYQDADVSDYKETEAITLPKLYGHDGTDSYSDARSQVLLSENPNAKPLDKTQESQRYIRNVCYLDKKAMERVSAAVFPVGDEELQAPDNMAGFVIEDREKGVVGYCLYDKEEKSIYDMAVLPEYRTDKNASSKKLFAEMMRTINKEGGEWSAEMRDKTTLKYLEIMAERGLVKFEKHGVDHVMSDGSQVVKVTFEPVRDDVRQATNKLKGRVEEATMKTDDIKANTDNQKHGAVIVKASDVREA